MGIGRSGLLPATFTDLNDALGVRSAKVKQLVHALARRIIQQNTHILRVRQGALRARGHSMAGGLSEAVRPRPAEEVLDNTENPGEAQQEDSTPNDRRPYARANTPRTKGRTTIMPYSAQCSQPRRHSAQYSPQMHQTQPNIRKRKCLANANADGSEHTSAA